MPTKGPSIDGEAWIAVQMGSEGWSVFAGPFMIASHLSEAIAHLIAVAPELLETLEEWHARPSDRWQDAIDTDDGYTLTPHNILENKTRDLIRKAKGQ